MHWRRNRTPSFSLSTRFDTLLRAKKEEELEKKTEKNRKTSPDVRVQVISKRRGKNVTKARLSRIERKAR